MELQNNREAVRRAEESRLAIQNTLAVAEQTVLTLSQMAAPVAAIPVPQAGNADLPVAAAPVTPVQAMQARLDMLRTKYGEDHPEMRRARAELAQLGAEQAQVHAVPSVPKPPAGDAKAADTKKDSEKAAVATAPFVRTRQTPEHEFNLGQAQERVVSLTSNIASLDNEIAARKGEDEKILQKIGGLQGKLGHLPVREQELAKITRDYEISKANYKTLLDKSLSAEMATDMEHRQKSERFTVLDPARVPERPTKPNRPLLGGAGSAAALGFGLLLCFGLEAQKGAFLGEWELPKRGRGARATAVYRSTRRETSAQAMDVTQKGCIFRRHSPLGIIAGIYLVRRPF